MEVQVDLTEQEPNFALRQADDFKGFKVVVRGSTIHALPDALAPIGRLAHGGDAMIRIEAVKQLAGDRSQDGDWQASFDQMLAYARTQGWIGDGGNAIRAHCEFEQAPSRTDA